MRGGAGAADFRRLDDRVGMRRNTTLSRMAPVEARMSAALDLRRGVVGRGLLERAPVATRRTLDRFVECAVGGNSNSGQRIGEREDCLSKRRARRLGPLQRPTRPDLATTDDRLRLQGRSQRQPDVRRRPRPNVAACHRRARIWDRKAGQATEYSLPVVSSV